MVIHESYNINFNEVFVMFLMSELIKCFINTFTPGIKSQS